jgi:hypothetical protein
MPIRLENKQNKRIRKYIGFLTHTRDHQKQTKLSSYLIK